jgi:hypothetical protein
LTVVVILVVAGVASWAGYRADSNKTRYESVADQDLNGLILDGELTNIDLGTLMATITWSITAVGSYTSEQFLYDEGSPLGYPDMVRHICASVAPLRAKEGLRTSTSSSMVPPTPRSSTSLPSRSTTAIRP